MPFKSGVLAAALAGLMTAGAAHAASVSINITEYGGSADISTALGDLDSFIGSTPYLHEGFESFTAGSTSNPSTSVGDFVGMGATGTGTTAIECGADPEGTTACVKPGGAAGGRYATEGTNWLDSNDMPKIVWTLPGAMGPMSFTKIAFLLTDIDDVGSVLFTLMADGSEISKTTAVNDQNGEKDGSLHLVTMLFGAPISDLVITMHNGNNDGFGIDSIKVGVVPLPAAGWMLLAGMGGLAMVRRRKRA